MSGKLRIFEITRNLWPDNFEVIYEESKVGSVKTIPNLVETYEKIESDIDKNDNLMVACTWSFHQSLWEYVEKSFKNRDLQVSKFDVPFLSFDSNMQENLSGEEWADERAFYQNK